MKNRITGLAFFTLLFTLGCSKTIYSTKQVMDSYKTKADVINRFGYPNERIKDNGTEEWLYDGRTIDKQPGLDDPSKQRPVAFNANPVNEKETAAAVYVTQFSQYQTFIKYTFDQNGRVLKWDSEGVNLAKKKAKPISTILLVLGIAATAIMIAGAIAVHNMHIDFRPI